MAYIVGKNRNQKNIITTFLDELIDTDNPIGVVDA